MVSRVLPAALLAWALLFAGCGPSVRDTIDDAAITARVQTALLNDPDIGASKIGVRTTSGVVALSGTLASKTEQDRALALVHQVPGVRDVQDLIQVSNQKPEVSNTSRDPGR
jgi:hyperosmotically inducible protein